MMVMVVVVIMPMIVVVTIGLGPRGRVIVCMVAFGGGVCATGIDKQILDLGDIDILDTFPVEVSIRVKILIVGFGPWGRFLEAVVDGSHLALHPIAFRIG